VKQLKLLIGAPFDVAVVMPPDAVTDIARGAVRAGVLHAHGLLSAEYLWRDWLYTGERVPVPRPAS
jgi:hypothetical protein